MAITEIAESLREKIVVNRVAHRVWPPEPLMDNALRQKLADARADKDQFANAVLQRLLTPEGLRSQIDSAWARAETDVADSNGTDLLLIAPGEEILDAVFMRFAGRHYRKREDGPAIAKDMEPPSEISQLLSEFLAG